MRRAIPTLLTVAAVIGLFLVLRGGEEDPYLVRGYFDNAAFVVSGEEVRIAGARVGTVEEVDVSRPGENVGEGEQPGKAVIVMRIDNPGFRDFRSDASCIVRPQSLLGEKYVECEPTQPRAPATTPAPALEPVADGERGAGELFLALQNNGKAVDLDLFNNIQRIPYRDRFRLILNELGAGLAGRGDDLREVVRRANPALRETDRVLAILAEQNRNLAKLAVDGDTALQPLARERASITGFLRNAGDSAQAAAERRAALEEGLSKFPGAVSELRRVMARLGDVTDAGQPLLADLGAAAPDLARGTRGLGPLANAGIPAIESLGNVAGDVGSDLKAADPVVRDTRRLGKSTAPLSKDLKQTLVSFDETGGIKNLLAFLRTSGAATNGYDSFGHFIRTNALISGCVDYQIRPLGGCVAGFGGVAGSSAAPAADRSAAGSGSLQIGDPQTSATAPAESDTGIPQLAPNISVDPIVPAPGSSDPSVPAPPADSSDPAADATTTAPAGRSAAASRRKGSSRRSSSFTAGDIDMLLNYLLGSGS